MNLGRARFAAASIAASMTALMALALVTVGDTQPVDAAEPTGVVTLVHGVRGLVADIYLDGTPALKVFEPERITDALTLAAGAHRVEVRPTGAAVESAPLLATTLTVMAGARQSAVVHLDAAGQPALTTYVDDVESIPVGSARLLVRHTAAAPAVAITVDGAAMSSVANGGQSTQILAAGTHVVAVTAGPAPLLPPREITFAEGTSTALYLVGSASSTNLAWLVESLPSTATAPAAVRTGNSPLDDSARSSNALVLWVVVLAVASVGIGTGLIRRRSRDHGFAGSAAASFAGLAMGVTSLAVVGRPPLHGGGRPTLGAAPSPSAPAKLAGLPVAKQASADQLFVSIGSRPAGLDTMVHETASRPVTVSIQPGDIVAHIAPERADPRTGEMQIPTDPKLVGWYAPGPAPGDVGSAVLAGHVAFDGTRGSFAGLLDLDPGAVVLVTFDDATVRMFRVIERRAYAKADLPTDELFRRSGPATLSLITCGGAFDPRTHSYADNVVVTAVPM